MNKEQFLKELEIKLSGLPLEDVQKTLDYYGEMIDDKIDGGLNEIEAITSMGTIDEIVSQIISETPIRTIIKEKVKTKRGPKVWEIILLILGAPLWIPLILSFFTIVASFVIVLFTLIISLYAVIFALAVSGICFTLLIIPFLITGLTAHGLFICGSGLLLCGISILLFLLSNWFVKGVWKATKACWRLFKKLLF